MGDIPAEAGSLRAIARRSTQPRSTRVAAARWQDGRSGARGAMKLGLIAGNGRFPFLVLDAARSLGHDVTVIALKEETFKDLEEAAARSPRAGFHWISI